MTLETTTPIDERVEMAVVLINNHKKVIDNLMLQCKKLRTVATLHQAEKIQSKIDFLVNSAHAMTAAADIIKAMKKLILAARIEADSPTLATEYDRREYAKRLLTALEVKSS